MSTILFVAEVSPIKPIMAAACVRGMNVASMHAAVATRYRDPRDEAHRTIMEKIGLAWPGEILSLGKIELFLYDLIICFATERTHTVFPALPGNPAVVYWNVPEIRSAVNEKRQLRNYLSLQQHICGLVRDLFRQGYLTALMEARRNAELVMDNLQEGIIAHDLNRKIFFFNQAAERITGYSRKEILGRDCHDVFPERFCKSNCSFCDIQAGLVLPDKPYSLVIRSKSGESRRIEMSVVPMKDFLAKPVGVVASFKDVTRELALASRLGEIEQFAGIIGRDSKMLELFGNIEELADSSVPVLIQGESGTGKELVAAAIHNEGERSRKLFVPVNCGALPENLLEAELFGHVKGAFTGAIRDKKGRFELADGGTIFLDEIGDITPAMQVKLLRVIQDGTFQRVGGEDTIKVDVRVISATHKDLRKEIAEGRFREDLYYRLCVVPVHLPALRERRNDIPLLARHFLKRLLIEENRPEILLSPEVLDVFMSYDWPGNVRELQNCIRYIMVRCRENFARPHHLPPNIQQEGERLVRVAAPRKRRGKLNEKAVQQAIKDAGGNRVQTARILGVSRATLYRFLAKHSM